MRKTSLCSKIAQLILFLSHPVLIVAQETELRSARDTLSPKSIGEVVISANRSGSFCFQTPEPIRVLNENTIHRFQQRTTPEALMLSPGVFVQKTNHGGGSPFLRGLTGNQTLLMVDGIRLSNATFRYGPNQYLNTIDPFAIEKIEVLRGSGSVQYGSDAMGGTIQVFSHGLMTTEKQEFGSNLLARLATQGMEQSLHASAHYSNKKTALRGGTTWRQFGDIMGGDTTGRQTPTGYKELDFDLKGKASLSPSTDLTVSYQHVHQNNVPVYHKITLEDYSVYKMDPQERDLGYVRLQRRFDKGGIQSALVGVSLHRSEEGREMSKNESDLYRTENDKVLSFGVAAEAVLASGGWSSVNGLEVYHDHVNSTRTDKNLSTLESVSKRGLYPDGATMTSLAVFSLHNFDIKDWNISAGGRFNSFIIKVSDEISGATTLTPSSLVGYLSVLRKLSSNSNVFVSGNSGFRAPNVDDLGSLGIVDFRYEIPNYDLKPEHSFQYQIGYKYQNWKLRGELYLYRNELYNLIVRNKMDGDSLEGYPVYKKENEERAFIQGVETAWDWQFSSSWSISGSLTYTYGQNLSKEEPVRRIPPLFGRLALEYNLRHFWINLEWQAAAKQERLATGDKEDNRIPEGGTPGWSIFNIHTGYTDKTFKIDLSILNLANMDYRYHGSGINGYGRSAILTISVNLSKAWQNELQ
jgi:outer membrane cobalamin receptor